MPRAVRFDSYGNRDVLYIADVPMPEPGAGEVVVEMRAAGINPGEASIREGRLHERFPASFPSGQGSDLAGVVSTVGPGVTEWSPGDDVAGWSWARSSHAEYVLVPSEQLVTKPPLVSWEAAGALNVAGCTAWAAVAAIEPTSADTVVVSAAAGGVGTIAVQLLTATGARILGIASESNDHWLRAHGVEPIPYGDRLAERLRAAAPDGVTAFIDLFGPQYIDLALELGVAPDRINTIISFERAAQVGAKTDGSGVGTSADVMSELLALMEEGKLEVPIAAAYPLAQVREAFAQLEERHTRGKIVLVP